MNAATQGIIGITAGVVAASLVGFKLASDSPPQIIPATIQARAADKTQFKPSVSIAPAVPAASLPKPPAATDLDQLVKAGDHSAVRTISELWQNSASVTDRQKCAEALALIGSAEAVQSLMRGIIQTKGGEERRILMQSLRLITSKDSLAVLVPALSKDYGKGNPLPDEIIGCVGKLAQSDTVKAIQSMHRQDGTKGNTGEQLVRAMAGIRNDAALPALLSVVEDGESDVLAKAALDSMNAIGVDAEELRALREDKVSQ